MQRDLLLLGEMIEAAERAIQVTNSVTVDELQADRLRKESLLWNFNVLGEAAMQVSEFVRERFPEISCSNHIEWACLTDGMHV